MGRTKAREKRYESIGGRGAQPVSTLEIGSNSIRCETETKPGYVNASDKTNELCGGCYIIN